MENRKNSNKKTNHFEDVPDKFVGKMRSDVTALEEQIKTDITPAIVASFGFIIALVWRDAINEVLDKFLESAGLTGQAYIYNFISAFLVTIVVIGIMIVVSKYGKSKKQDEIKKIVKEKELGAHKIMGGNDDDK